MSLMNLFEKKNNPEQKSFFFIFCDKTNKIELRLTFCAVQIVLSLSASKTWFGNREGFEGILIFPLYFVGACHFCFIIRLNMNKRLNKQKFLKMDTM